jgi:hypothetical protein
VAAAPAGNYRPDANSADDSADFILTALREARELVSVAIGKDRSRELRAEGAAMTMDDAVSYALANIDPKLLTGPVASIDR